MATIKEYLDYAELAQASYINGFQTGMYGIDSYIVEKKNILYNEFSVQQATDFANRYEVKATTDTYGIGNSSGLDAVLFYDTVDNKYVMSIRGTEITSLDDIWSDILLVKDGIAYDQTNDLNLFYETLITNKVLSSTDNLDVTGHSLGGVLAQVFAATYPNVVNNAYTYNAPGIGGLGYQAYENLGINPATFSYTNITNIYAQEGSEVTSGLGALLGNVVPISIDQNTFDAQNHQMPYTTQSLYVYNMLSKIANTQNLNLLTSIMEDVTNEKVIQVIEVAFSDQQSGSIIDQSIALTNNNQGKATGLTNLTDKLPSQLQSKDPANLYALLNLNPFAIEGNLSAYTTINPADYSDMYMSDRTEFFYNNLHAITSQGTVYQDIKSGINNGFGLNKVVFGTEGNNHTLSGFSGDDRIYGLGGNDVLVGGAGYDYMEGGTGDDTLSGGADNDTLFGDTGNDILYGDSGDDALIGGEGYDALFGGSGSDTLLGQAGDDVLAGADASNLYAEKTHDYLLGGTGFDTYYVSDQDVINDADGSGLIMFNDKSLSGKKTKIPDTDMYEDTYFTYEDSNGYLIVREKSSNEVVVIENWDNTNGMLGIKLDDGSDDSDGTKKDIEIYVGDATVTEGGTLEFTIGIDNTLDEDLVVNASTYFNGSANSSDLSGTTNGTITIKAGTTYGTFDIGTVDDTIVEPTENFISAVTGLAEAYGGDDMNSYLIKNAGEGTIVDNDKKTDKEIAISIGSGSRYEGGGEIAFTVSISEALDEEISIGYQATSEGNSLVAGYYNVVIGAGKTSAELVVPIVDDDIPEENEAILLSYVGFGYNGGDIASATGSDGNGTILDDDEDEDGDGHPMDPAPIEPPRCEPLVLDMDKDGFISTTSLEESTAYFDLTGDGIKEKVGWLQANDGLVAYDKNANGKIDGIDEVFGNQTIYGFDELRETADSNYDGIIDRRDELYNQLKIWQDTNQDGTSQADELKSLSEAGVRSINLSAVGTNIELNGNIIVEASKYTDSEGNLELAADIEFTFDSRITKIDTSTIENYIEHPDSSTLPNLRGYGIVSDSYITYNIDENFRTLALEFGADVTKVANEFESFMDGWSGYTKMQTDLQTKYNLNDTPKLSDLDRKVWTYEHFMGTGSFSAGIEQRLETTAKAMQTGGSDIATAGRYNTAVVNSVYDSFTDRNRAFFSLKAFYPDVLSDALYEYGIDEYVITDQEALSAKVSAYINNPDNTLQEKLYLVSQMNTLQGTFLDFNAESITSNIDDTLVKNLVTSIYNDTLNAHVYDKGGIYSNKITFHLSQNYTLLFNINLFQQDLLSQNLKKDIINNNFFIFKNTLHVKDIKNKNLLNEVA